MKQILTYADRVGRQNIADAVGVGLTAVSNAVVRGHFPASWFLTMRKAGLEPPETLFVWKNLHQESPSVGSDGSLACAPDMVAPVNDCKGAL